MKIADLVKKPGKASSWRGVKMGDAIHIFHCSTKMAVVHDGRLTQVSSGWGSMTDKCGMAKLRNGARANGLEFTQEI
jgi:hypothetical protein